jgi:hypothetical protein
MGPSLCNVTAFDDLSLQCTVANTTAGSWPGTFGIGNQSALFSYNTYEVHHLL